MLAIEVVTCMEGGSHDAHPFGRSAKVQHRGGPKDIGAVPSGETRAPGVGPGSAVDRKGPANGGSRLGSGRCKREPRVILLN